MEPWQERAHQDFPDREEDPLDPKDSLVFLFFDLLREAIQAHAVNDVEHLEKIYAYAEWCYTQNDVRLDYRGIAHAAFYEHLGDDPATYHAIPHWVSPAIFSDLMPEWKDRLDNKAKYPMKRAGSFQQLVETYDAVNGTHFAAENGQQSQ